MIVQELHHIQHEWGYLPREQLLALVERLNAGKTDRRDETKLYQLHQIASYFPHFRLQPPPAVDVRVCRDMACFRHGGPECRTRLEAVAREIGGRQVQVGGASCLGQCDRPVAVSINDQVYRGKTFDELRELVQMAARGEALPPQTADGSPVPWQIDPYRGEPTYAQARRFIDAWRANPTTDLTLKRQQVTDPILQSLETAKLRGMGGAAFATNRKWATVRGAPGTVKYSVCNADESEPGTFKDRELLRRAPHLVIEGMILGALTTGSQRGWIFIRHEYQEEIAAVRRALDDARRQGVVGERLLGSDLSFPLEVFVSPGGYICGEETALLEVLQDHRAEPRNKPPLMSLEGLFGKPTSMNNVETFSWVPSIMTHGGEWYRDQGVNGSSGLRMHSVSGDVSRPGVYEIPFGLTLGELLHERAGGLLDGRPLKAVSTSGPSGGFLPPTIDLTREPRHFVEGLVKRGVVAEGAKTLDLLRMQLDPDLFRPFPEFMLGAAIVVYAEPANMFEHALNCVEFFRNESCGKCVPCRIGSEKMAEMLRQVLERRGEFDQQLIGDLGGAMYDTSICGLGQVVPNSIRSVVKYFPDDLQAVLK